MNPELDLTIERIIRAPRATVWAAWVDPKQIERWWLPAPMSCRVERWEPRAGGAFVTSMSETGSDFVPHMDACFLVVDDLERIVFTNAIDAHWRPTNAMPVRMTAEITLADHPDGTSFRAVVRHADPTARALHEDLGFFDGWGTVTAQLADLVEASGASAHAS